MSFWGKKCQIFSVIGTVLGGSILIGSSLMLGLGTNYSYDSNVGSFQTTQQQTNNILINKPQVNNSIYKDVNWLDCGIKFNLMSSKGLLFSEQNQKNPWDGYCLSINPDNDELILTINQNDYTKITKSNNIKFKLDWSKADWNSIFVNKYSGTQLVADSSTNFNPTLNGTSDLFKLEKNQKGFSTSTKDGVTLNTDPNAENVISNLNLSFKDKKGEIDKINSLRIKIAKTPTVKLNKSNVIQYYTDNNWPVLEIGLSQSKPFPSIKPPIDKKTSYQWEYCKKGIISTKDTWTQISGDTSNKLTINKQTYTDFFKNKPNVDVRLVINNKYISEPCHIEFVNTNKVSISLPKSNAQEWTIEEGKKFQVKVTVNREDKNEDIQGQKYEWYRIKPNGTKEQTKEELIKGQNSNTLTINKIDKSWDQNKIIVKMVNEKGVITSSSSGPISVANSPSIKIDELTSNIQVNQKLTINANVENVNSKKINYSWFYSEDGKKWNEINDNFNGATISLTKTGTQLNFASISEFWNNKYIKVKAKFQQQLNKLPRQIDSNSVIIKFTDQSTSPPQEELPGNKPQPPSSDAPIKPQPEWTISFGVSASNFGEIYVNGKPLDIKDNPFKNMSYASFVKYARRQILPLETNIETAKKQNNNSEVQLLQSKLDLYNKVVLCNDLMIAGACLVPISLLTFIVSLILIFMNKNRMASNK